MQHGPHHLVRRASRAFSLVELVVAVAIIGIVAAIATPRMATATSAFRVSSAAYTVRSALELTRETAAASGVTLRVTIDAAGGTMTIDAYDTTAATVESVGPKPVATGGGKTLAMQPGASAARRVAMHNLEGKLRRVGDTKFDGTRIVLALKTDELSVGMALSGPSTFRFDAGGANAATTIRLTQAQRGRRVLVQPGLAPMRIVQD